MKTEQIIKKLKSIGIEARPATGLGVFADLETIRDNTAHRIDRAAEGQLMGYLKRSRRRWEYRGHYTAILIYC